MLASIMHGGLVVGDKLVPTGLETVRRRQFCEGMHEKTQAGASGEGDVCGRPCVVGLQMEGNWVLPLPRVDFWRKDGNTFPFAVPPEAESAEIKTQGLPLECHVQDTLFLESATALLSVKRRGKNGYRKE